MNQGLRQLFRSIKYPNAIEDIVVVEFRDVSKIGFTVRPKYPGRYRLMSWPSGMPDTELFIHSVLIFSTQDGPPSHCVFDFSNHIARDIAEWQWVLVKAELEGNVLTDFANAVTNNRIVANGSFELFLPNYLKEVRTLAWSCHMPYDTSDNGVAIAEEDSAAILEWYESEARKFHPHVIWGSGDSAYSDGTEGTDFSNQVYDKGKWYHSPANRNWLRSEYRNMYRHFWSLRPMSRVM